MKLRYQLSLDSHFYNISTNSITYRFKVFGEHTFPKFTFQLAREIIKQATIND